MSGGRCSARLRQQRELEAALHLADGQRAVQAVGARQQQQLGRARGQKQLTQALVPAALVRARRSLVPPIRRSNALLGCRAGADPVCSFAPFQAMSQADTPVCIGRAGRTRSPCAARARGSGGMQGRRPGGRGAPAVPEGPRALQRRAPGPAAGVQRGRAAQHARQRHRRRLRAAGHACRAGPPPRITMACPVRPAPCSLHGSRPWPAQQLA